MELTELKHAWNTVDTPVKSADDIKLMLSENRHPVLKKIKRQLTVEFIGWSAFLACYYTLFDAGHKSIWINIVLIVSVLLPLVHNLMGYRFAKYLVDGPTIREALANYLSKLKIYAIVSVFCRLLLITGLLIFFTNGISLDTKRAISLTIILLIFSIQLFLLSGLWMKRLKRLENAIMIFN